MQFQPRLPSIICTLSLQSRRSIRGHCAILPSPRPTPARSCNLDNVWRCGACRGGKTVRARLGFRDASVRGHGVTVWPNCAYISQPFSEPPLLSPVVLSGPAAPVQSFGSGTEMLEAVIRAYLVFCIPCPAYSLGLELRRPCEEMVPAPPPPDVETGGSSSSMTVTSIGDIQRSAGAGKRFQ